MLIINTRNAGPKPFGINLAPIQRYYCGLLHHTRSDLETDHENNGESSSLLCQVRHAANRYRPHLTDSYREWQYKEQTLAWGYRKYNKQDHWLCLDGMIKRRNLDFGDIESVDFPVGSLQRSLSGKGLKKRIQHSRTTAKRTQSRGT